MKQLFSLILIASLLTGCGIKRPLELPGSKSKHATAEEQKPATADITLPGDALSATPPSDNTPTQLQPQ